MASPGATRQRGLRRRLWGDCLARGRCAGTLDGGSDPEGRNDAGCRIFWDWRLKHFFGREGRRFSNTMTATTNSFEDFLGVSSSPTDVI